MNQQHARQLQTECARRVVPLHVHQELSNRQRVLQQQTECAHHAVHRVQQAYIKFQRVQPRQIEYVQGAVEHVEVEHIKQLRVRPRQTECAQRAQRVAVQLRINQLHVHLHRIECVRLARHQLHIGMDLRAPLVPPHHRTGMERRVVTVLQENGQTMEHVEHVLSHLSLSGFQRNVRRRQTHSLALSHATLVIRRQILIRDLLPESDTEHVSRMPHQQPFLRLKPVLPDNTTDCRDV